ncbi:MAG: cysteine--tRNA ligase [Nanoarchaeota archaeon]|nr:cysteine--tRNA ligase [Nanoarchaeota archaeon]
MTIQFYNTLTRKKEQFSPIEKGVVKVYSCGPTVYSHPHIGNWRAYIFSDVLKKVMRYFSYEVIDVINITDVGHLVSDSDDGEDKMLKASKKENLDPYQIARKYEGEFIKGLEKLHIQKPNYLPRATEHIKEQIEIIDELKQKDIAYLTDDGIYFDVSKFKDYGKLSGQKLEEKESGARVELDSQKRNPQDFALWKFLTGDNKNHIMKWDSPWGVGFPGWHIECSAMSSKYLGNHFDIHTGGIDHIPVHHENEIAQNSCSRDIKVNYWIHNDFITVDGEKLSKSLGNSYTLEELEEKGYSALDFREMCLRSHYKKGVNFTFNSLTQGKSSVKKINDFYDKLQNLEASDVEDSLVEVFKQYMDEYEAALKDDLNTPEAMAAMYNFMNRVNKESALSQGDIDLALEFITRVDSVFSLLEKEESISSEIIELAEKRKEARDNKNWELADQLRDELKELGFEIKDDKSTKEGYRLSKL